MKQFIYLALLTCVMGIISCGPSKAERAQQEQAMKDSIQRALTDSIHRADSIAKAKADSIEQNAKFSEKAVLKRVNAIYSNVFSKEAFDENSDKLYFSQAYKNIMKQIHRIASQNPGELIGLDYDHWTQSQEPCQASFKVLSANVDSKQKATAKVKVNVFGGSYRPVTLKLVYENNNWFIDDMIVNGNSEVGDLKQTIKEYR